MIFQNKVANKGTSILRERVVIFNHYKFELACANVFLYLDCNLLIPGKYGDGDVYKSENIISFSNYIHDITAGLGVHFMMADGVRSLLFASRKFDPRIFVHPCVSVFSGFLRRRMREHPGNQIKTYLSVSISGSVVDNQAEWAFRVQTIRRVHTV